MKRLFSWDSTSSVGGTIPHIHKQFSDTAVCPRIHSFVTVSTRREHQTLQGKSFVLPDFLPLPTSQHTHTHTHTHILDTSHKPMEKAMAPHSTTLAWKIPWTEEPGRLQSMGLLRVWHNWATSLSLFTFMHWRRKWQPIPVLLPGESQGRGNLVGCRLWGHTELDTTEVTWQQQQHHKPKLLPVLL